MVKKFMALCVRSFYWVYDALHSTGFDGGGKSHAANKIANNTERMRNQSFGDYALLISYSRVRLSLCNGTMLCSCPAGAILL